MLNVNCCRKSLLLKIAFALAFSFMFIVGAQASMMTRIPIEDVITRRTVVVTDPISGERTFLHLRAGCGELIKGQSVSLDISGSLNGNSDFLKIDNLYRCAIDQAEPFTQKLYLHYFTSGSSEILITDETEKQYLLQFDSRCQAMPQFRNNYIFAVQGGDALAKSDKIYLPDKAGECNITDVKPYGRQPKAAENKTLRDTQLPTSVTSLKAIPGNGQVYLTWRPAQDNKGIKEYWVSYQSAPFNPTDIPDAAMPNLTASKTTRTIITDLTNGESYYFFVAAVDTSGNVSSDWASAKATPRDILLPSGSKSDLGLTISSETSTSYTIRWNAVPGALRYRVALDIGSKHEFVYPQYAKKYIQIAKTPERKGKNLVFKVKAMGLYGVIKEQIINLKY